MILFLEFTLDSLHTACSGDLLRSWATEKPLRHSPDSNEALAHTTDVARGIAESRATAFYERFDRKILFTNLKTLLLRNGSLPLRPDFSSSIIVVKLGFVALLYKQVGNPKQSQKSPSHHPAEAPIFFICSRHRFNKEMITRLRNLLDLRGLLFLELGEFILEPH